MMELIIQMSLLRHSISMMEVDVFSSNNDSQSDLSQIIKMYTEIENYKENL